MKQILVSVSIHSLVKTDKILKASFEQYSPINVLKWKKWIIKGTKISVSNTEVGLWFNEVRCTKLFICRLIQCNIYWNVFVSDSKWNQRRYKENRLSTCCFQTPNLSISDNVFWNHVLLTWLYFASTVCQTFISAAELGQKILCSISMYMKSMHHHL